MNPDRQTPAIRTETIERGGMQFTVDTCGPADGAPVLLLHGFPQSRHAWRDALPALGKAGYRALAPDQRGYSTGARPSRTEDYVLDELVGDAFGIIDAIGAPRFHLVGHDWGGHIAWTMALRQPQRVISLAVLSRPHPAAFADALRNDPQQAARSGHHSSLLAPGVAANLRAADFAPFRTMFRNQRVPDTVAERYLATLREPGAIEAAIEWYRAGAASFRNAANPPASMRTLYIWGDQDATVGRHAAEATARFVSGPYRFAQIAGGGHFLTDDHPQQVNALLLEHLAAGSA